jgi:hypothetical protein
MKQKQPPHEGRDKVAVSDDVSPMENFKQLTRGLLKVSREQLQIEQKRYQESRSDKSVKNTPDSVGSSSRKRK